MLLVFGNKQTMKTQRRKGTRRIILFACLMISLPVGILSTQCPIDPDLDVGEAGNSYECPDTLPDGTENTYNTCCHNERADENGEFHSCCQDPEVAKAESMAKFIGICTIMGGVTAGAMGIVYVRTYCKEDTFRCLRPIRRELKKWFDMCMDALCFCGCCPKKLRRKGKKDDVEEDTKKVDDGKPDDDPSRMEVDVDSFWI